MAACEKLSRTLQPGAEQIANRESGKVNPKMVAPVTFESTRGVWKDDWLFLPDRFTSLKALVGRYLRDRRFQTEGNGTA